MSDDNGKKTTPPREDDKCDLGSDCEECGKSGIAIGLGTHTVHGLEYPCVTICPVRDGKPLDDAEHTIDLPPLQIAGLMRLLISAGAAAAAQTDRMQGRTAAEGFAIQEGRIDN